MLGAVAAGKSSLKTARTRRSHHVTVAFSGVGSHAASTSEPIVLSVAKASTTAVAAPAAKRFGKPVKLFAANFAANQAANGGLKPDFREEVKLGSQRPPPSGLSATIVEISQFSVLVSVPSALAPIIEELPRMLWRLELDSPDVTTKRQLEALKRLSMSWSDIVRMRKEGPKRRSLSGDSTPEDEGDATPASEWNRGELRVRSVVLGDPKTAESAATPPPWGAFEAWKAAAARLLAADAGLNNSQRSAVAASLSTTFTLWQGPPGTGKTRTLTALLAIMALASREVGVQRGVVLPILACGDTNVAADGLADGLGKAGVRVVRLGPLARVGAGVRKLTLEVMAADTPDGREAASLRDDVPGALLKVRIMERVGGEAYEKAKAFHTDLRREIKRREMCAIKDVLSWAEVVCCTTTAAADPRLMDTTFPAVALDEATQATEPSLVIPLLRGAHWAVLVGDPKQLPPTVTSAVAVGVGLDQTMFERLQRGGEGREGVVVLEWWGERVWGRPRRRPGAPPWPPPPPFHPPTTCPHPSVPCRPGAAAAGHAVPHAPRRLGLLCAPLLRRPAQGRGGGRSHPPARLSLARTRPPRGPGGQRQVARGRAGRRVAVQPAGGGRGPAGGGSAGGGGRGEGRGHPDAVLRPGRTVAQGPGAGRR